MDIRRALLDQIKGPGFPNTFFTTVVNLRDVLKQGELATALLFVCSIQRYSASEHKLSHYVLPFIPGGSERGHNIFLQHPCEGKLRISNPPKLCSPGSSTLSIHAVI